MSHLVLETIFGAVIFIDIIFLLAIISYGFYRLQMYFTKLSSRAQNFFNVVWISVLASILSALFLRMFYVMGHDVMTKLFGF